VSFAKFAQYFDVGVKFLPIGPNQYVIDPEQVRTLLNGRIADDVEVMRSCRLRAEQVGDRRFGELVMAVACVVGTTYTGHCDDVAGIDRVLSEDNWDIPIHVDAASGGFVVPFSQPELHWDFRLPHVQSINVSNHKYGLVYAGLGTLVFRSAEVVPPELQLQVGSAPSCTTSASTSRAPAAG
jgi:glutamate decarboxylase